MNSPLNPIPISTLPYFPQMEPRDFIPRPQRLLRTHPAHSQVFRTNENRPVGFSAAGKIFAARDFFDGLPVGSECFQLALAIPPEMIVQGLFADFTTYAAFSVLAPKGDDFAIKDISLLRRRKFQSARAGAFFTGMNITLPRAGITKSLECLTHNRLKRCDLGVRQFFEFA